MTRFAKLLCCLAALAAAPQLNAFSLMGPLAGWQTAEIGYGQDLDVGGPMNLGEEYRWNLPTIYYGYDPSYLDYFGQVGVQAVEEAIAMINGLPAMSSLSRDLSEFPLDTRRINHRAAALSLFDVRSFALSMLLEELGLASPDRYVFTLRGRVLINNVPTYSVIRRSFDPETLVPSPYVNGTLYTYQIEQTGANPDVWEAVPIVVDPTSPRVTAAATFLGGGTIEDSLGSLLTPIAAGLFFTGLTRDDVGGLRYIYNENNYNVENVAANTTGSGTPVWGIPGGTNTLIDLALRPGIDRVRLERVDYDALLGTFLAVTNRYQETVITNNVRITQVVERAIAAPDLIFSAQDLGLDAAGVPIFYQRTAADTWLNNDASNGNATLDGPGVIPSGIVITFSKLGPFGIHVGEGGVESEAILTRWGYFDGTTNEPVIFPVGTSIRDVEDQVLETRRRLSQSVWRIAP